MTEFDELVRIMGRLRGPDGCPWDREQTHETLKPYLLEECYEALEAIDSGDPKKLCSELGDVLLQIVFHAQLARECGAFDVRDVCARINEKLIHRHPHVFGDVEVSGSEEVLDNWEHLKRQEHGARDRESVLDGIPRAMPALKCANELQKKAAKVGFDWRDVSGPREKVCEELAELDEARRDGETEEIASEVGDLLFAIVNLARHLELDAEDALRQACGRFERRFRRVEQQASAQGRELREMSLAEMDELWEASKKEEHRATRSLSQEHRADPAPAGGEGRL